MNTDIRQPLRVLPERVYRVYRGGRLLDAYRGVEPAADGAFPEDWVASDTRAVNPGREHMHEGLSRVVLPGGQTALLRDLITAQPEAMLGAAHVARWGAQAAVLVKLLDAAERLPVHWHPGRDFIARHRGGWFGKTECWLIRETRVLDGEPSIYLGLRQGVTVEQFKGWVRAQDAERLPGALNRLKVSPGDVYVIPAGLPHAIGAGVMMIEVQEPSDWSIHAEYAPFGLGEDEAHQGFGWEAAFEALDAVACTPEDIRQRLKQETPVVRQVGDSVERRLIAPEYAGYFGASEATVRGALPLEGGRLAIGLVDAGEGRVEAGGGALSLARGTTFVLPAAASDARLVSSGGDALRVTLCYPPAA
ncbi:MAG TPA: class I mannose-6-phosphate isomerase [Aggregatilineales bacterium]|nr:class I mannose-6-phosphate isomerase [Aggregatilineales bacterium]HQA69047.1 class I mannose-6-phosphate isomerase [Aggregatilineales bacterium]